MRILQVAWFLFTLFVFLFPVMILPYKLCPLEFYRNVDCLVEEFELGPNAIGVYTDRSSFNVGHVGPMMGKQGHVITIDGEGFGMDLCSLQ